MSDHDTITRLQGEAAVMIGLLTEAVAVLQTIEPECATEDEILTRLRIDILAVLQAWAKRGGMSSQHTPGPWKSLPEEADKPYIRIRGTALGRRYKIANVMDPGYSGVTDQDFDETRANARLIANAPDMYAALLEITQISEYNTSSMGWVVKRAKDAIAKTMGPA